MERAKAASARAEELSPHVPEVDVARAWVLYAEGSSTRPSGSSGWRSPESPTARAGTTCSAGRLFAAGRYQELADIADVAIQASGEDYNVYSPIQNALGALGKPEALRNLRQRRTQAIEAHLRKVPEDVRARMMLGIDYAIAGRTDDAMREVNLATMLRPDEAMVLYNAACAFCVMRKTTEAIDALRKAWHAGYRDANWTRRDPDLAILHGHPEFERLYPEKAGA